MFLTYKHILKITQELIKILEVWMKVYQVICQLTWTIKMMLQMFPIMMRRMKGESIKINNKMVIVKVKGIDHRISRVPEIKDLKVGLQIN